MRNANPKRRRKRALNNFICLVRFSREVIATVFFVFLAAIRRRDRCNHRNHSTPIVGMGMATAGTILAVGMLSAVDWEVSSSSLLRLALAAAVAVAVAHAPSGSL